MSFFFFAFMAAMEFVTFQVVDDSVSGHPTCYLPLTFTASGASLPHPQVITLILSLLLVSFCGFA